MTEAGRDLDFAVAKAVMGWRFDGRNLYDGGGRNRGWWRDGFDAALADECPRYSTDIAAAWAVIEKLKESGWWAQIKSCWNNDGWCVELHRVVKRDSGDLNEVTESNHGPLPPAICLAALAAVGAPAPAEPHDE